MNALKQFWSYISVLWDNKDDIDKAVKGFTKATNDLKRIKENMERERKKHTEEIIRLEKEKIVKEEKSKKAENIIKGIERVINNDF